MVSILKIIVFTIGLLLCFPTVAEQNYDAKLVDELIEAGIQHSIKSPQQGIDYYQQQLKEHPNLSEISRSTLKVYLATQYLIIGQIDKVKELIDFNDADLLLKFPPKVQISYLILQANFTAMQGNEEEALHAFEQAKKIAESGDDEAVTADVYGALGYHYALMNKHIKALEYLYQSHAIFSKLDDQLQVAYLELSMTKAHIALFDYDQAIELQTKALAYFRSKELYFDELVSLYFLAMTHLQKQEHDKARIYFEQMLELDEKIADPLGKFLSHLGLADIYTEKQDIKTALSHFNISEKLINHVQEASQHAYYNFVGAQIYLGLGDYEKAKVFLDKAGLLLDKIVPQQRMTSQLKYDKLSSTLAQKQGNYALAHQHLQNYIKHNDELYNVIREVTRSKHKVSLDTQQIELDNQLLAKDKELQKVALQAADKKQQLQTWLMMLMSLFLLLLLLFGWRQYRLRRAFKLLAATDSLTKVANRRAVITKVQRLWDSNTHFTLIAVDIDHFKQVNDQHGHGAGDDVLVTVAKRFTNVIRDHDTLGRIGGEEFLIILPNANLQQALEIAERLRTSLSTHVVKSGEQKLVITASFGVVERTEECTSVKDILRQTDEALYRAKQYGRNRVEHD